MNCFRKLITLIILINSSYILSAQLNYKEGSIVTKNNELIQGYIYDGGWIKNSNYCIYKETKSSEEVRYFPEDIISYKIKDEKYYVSRTINNSKTTKQCFLEVILEGEINLYYNYNSSYPLYYIETDKGGLIPLKNQDYNNANLQYEYPTNWKAYKLGTNVFKDTLYNLFKDCIPVLNQLDIVEYNHKSLQRITSEYLNQQCTNSECVTYKKNLNISKPTFGVFTGLQLSKILFYSYLIDSQITQSLPFGILYNIPLSIFTERLSFQTELIANKIIYNKDFLNQSGDYDDLKISSTAIGVPVLLKYAFPFERISPSFGIGKETGFIVDSKVNYDTQRYNSEGILEYGGVDYFIQRFQKGGWFLNAGLDYSINPRLRFFADLRFQKHLNLIIADEHYNYYSFSSAEKSIGSTKYITYSSTFRIGIIF